VNGSDFAILAANFGTMPRTFAQGDLNGDQSVNGSDFAILAANFGRSVPQPAVVDAAAFATKQAAAPARSDSVAPSRGGTTSARKPAPARRALLVPKARKKP
jgi:hypothetical protein